MNQNGKRRQPVTKTDILEGAVESFQEVNSELKEVRQVISSMNTPTLTPQERIQAFGQELAVLCQKYGVEFRPFIKSYNGGQQIADVEFVAVGK